MISVQLLWQRVNDLSRKDKGAYSSNDSFNRDVNEAQNVLMDYYMSMTGPGGRLREGVNRFIKQEIELTPKQYPFFSLPDDYRQHFDLGVIPADGCEDGSLYRAHFLNSQQSLVIEESPIRRPSMKNKRFAYQVYNGQVRIFPRDFVGRVFLTYFVEPSLASRAVTIVNSEEVYDPDNTVDLEWPYSEFHNFVDLLLLFKGVAIRESAIINWVIGRKSLQAMPEAMRSTTERRI